MFVILQTEYHQIKVQVQRFAAELLDLCRSSLEIRTMVGEEKDVKKINTAGHVTSYPRILLALYYEQKQVKRPQLYRWRFQKPANLTKIHKKPSFELLGSMGNEF